MSAADVAIVSAFRAGWSLVHRCPDHLADAGFRRLADTLWRRQASDVVQLEKNLARIHPALASDEIHEMSRQSLRSYMRYWREAFEVPHWKPGHVRDAFAFENPEAVDAAVNAGTGVILVATHSGSWDLAGAWAADRYGSVTTVAERLKPEALYQEFVRHRTAFGAEIFPTGTPHVLDVLAERVSAGKVVALMGDRDISRRGIHVPLFGEPASLPAGPARLALMTGAPLLPIDLWYGPSGACARVGDPIVLPPSGTDQERLVEAVARIASAFEGSLRTHSVDWHMMQPVWVDDLDATRRPPAGEPTQARSS